MKIFLDSNITYTDLLLAGPPMTLLERFLKHSENELCIPQVVIDETVRHFNKKYSSALRSFQKMTWISSVINQDVGQLIGVEDAEKDYRSVFLDRLKSLNARIIPLPEIETKIILKRDLAGRKPFDASGKGFRDTLIWENVLEDCAQHSEVIVIISADSDFGIFSKETNGLPKLHDDLKNDLTSAGYSPERVLIRRSIDEFNKEFAALLISFSYQIGEDVKGTFVENLDPGKILTSIGEEAAAAVHRKLSKILPINDGAIDSVSFLRWPENEKIIEAYDLGEGLNQILIRTAIVFDTDIYGSDKDRIRLVEFTSKKPIILMGTSWDENSREFFVRLRIHVIADFVCIWNTTKDSVISYELIQMGFSDTDLRNHLTQEIR